MQHLQKTWGRAFFPFWNLSPSGHFPFFSHTYVEPILQPLCFDVLPSNGGVWGVLITRTPKNDFYPEGASRPRNLSCSPMRIPVLSSIATKRSLFHGPRNTERGSRFSFAPYFVTSLPHRLLPASSL